MATETLNFKHLRAVDTQYPETGNKMKLGGGYTFASKASAPPQRRFRVSIEGLRIYQNGDGSINDTINPTTNVAVFDKFYRDHELSEEFYYNHPWRGQVLVRFADPVTVPDPIVGGSGLIPAFDFVLEEQP